MFGQLHVLPLALAPHGAGPIEEARLELIADRASACLVADRTVVRVSGRNPRVLVGCTPDSSYGWTADVPSRYAATNIAFSVLWTHRIAGRETVTRAEFQLRLVGREASRQRFWSMQDADLPAHPEASPYRGPVVDLGAPPADVRRLTIRPLDFNPQAATRPAPASIRRAPMEIRRGL